MTIVENQSYIIGIRLGIKGFVYSCIYYPIYSFTPQ